MDRKIEKKWGFLHAILLPDCIYGVNTVSEVKWKQRLWEKWIVFNKHLFVQVHLKNEQNNVLHINDDDEKTWKRIFYRNFENFIDMHKHTYTDINV